MNSSLVTPLIIVLFSLFLNHSSVKPFEYNLQGLVTSKKTGKPLADIYLYTVKGEEEAITDQKGEFRFVNLKTYR